jgi:hypothetical protein
MLLWEKDIRKYSMTNIGIKMQAWITRESEHMKEEQHGQ